MTDRDRRVSTLAVAFSPGRAEVLLARLGAPLRSAAVAHAARLAVAPRRERLQALAAALAPDGAAPAPRAEAIASLERSRVAAVVRALASMRACDGVSPLLLRLCREQLARREPRVDPRLP